MLLNERDLEDSISVFFGLGCFWHMQHEFFQAEKAILERRNQDVSALAGYAGGAHPSDKVCYHNSQGVGDYGKQGYAEAVHMDIPRKSFGAFAK